MRFDYPQARTVGVIAVAVVIMMLTVSFRLSTLASLFQGGGQHYAAAFTDASGISPGDEVRVAGIPVGKVDSVGVVRAHAVVTMTLNQPVRLGRQTSASLSLDTLLGQHSLVLRSAGPGRLASDATIPLARTSTPFGVSDALVGAGRTFSAIDTGRLSRAVRTVSAAIGPSSPDVRAAARGLSGLARAVGQRQAQVHDLFRQTAMISSTLARRSHDVEALLHNSGQILQTLRRRQTVIRSLVHDVGQLSATITAVIRENRGQTSPTLKRLQQVLQILRNHQADLDETLRLYAPYLRYFTNVVGNGRWFDGTFAGLVPVDLRGAGVPRGSR